MEQIAEQIAEQKIAELVPEIQKTAYIQAYNDIVDALTFDVTSAVYVAFDNAREIFYDKKTQKVVADAVMKELRKQLNHY